MGSGPIRGAPATVPKNGNFGVWRVALTWAVLVVFALQSWVTQTHLHRTSAVAVAASTLGEAAVKAPAPVDHETVACPLCQAVAAAGAFTGPAPVAVPAPVIRTATAMAAPMIIGLVIPAAGHSWRSRAPPQL